MSDTNENHRADGVEKVHGGAMPMPHGSDEAAPLPADDGAMPMPHGSEAQDDSHTDDGALPMPHGPADAAPPAQDGAMPMPHATQDDAR